MIQYKNVLQQLQAAPSTWLVTGVAGFIGSNLLQQLLRLNQNVIGLDNFSTGFWHNLSDVQGSVTSQQWARFHLFEGDTRDIEVCQKSCSGVDYVLHHAALGSVPRSINDPVCSNESNVTGFLNMLVAARDKKVKNFVYAGSSSTYGDHPALPRMEDRIGKPLSPYAVTKYVNELYADVFAQTYGFCSTGLRYFNVFGKRQNPDGAYAAVIPKWIAAMLKGEGVFINGDGLTSRDFCYVENVIKANLLAATAPVKASHRIFNVAVGDQTNLLELFAILKRELASHQCFYEQTPIFKGFRQGDILHSKADISRIREQLGYMPEFNIEQGLAETVKWYLERNCP